MSRLTLSRAVSLAVLTSAKTEADHHEDLGCSILGPPSRPVRKALSWLSQRIHELGGDEAQRNAVALVRALEDTPKYAALCEGTKRRKGRRVLREQILFPRAEKTPPRVLHVRRDELAFDVPVTRPRDWPALNALFSTLAQGATTTELAQLGKANATVREVITQLKAARWLDRWTAPNTKREVVFVGHNTTLIRGRETSVLIDPYFRPASVFDLPNYQPMQPRDLGHVNAVAITHSHGDHFHLGSLLQLPPETRFFVPPVERENLFSTDCAARLRQLGFAHVEPLDWWSSRAIGDCTVQALPFFGEQPSAAEGVHPGLRNVGSTWKVTTEASYAFFADAGRDALGDMKTVCQRARGVDVLFCGVRGFKLQPLFFGSTTLGAFLVDVPESELTKPQQLMADGPQALDYAKRLGAKTLVPCADGGAPWYWREGMGPRYPGYPGQPVLGASRLDENPDADPFPERIQRRAGDPKLAILRPGQDLSGTAHKPFQWPFSAGGAAGLKPIAPADPSADLIEA
ncbi:MAG: MBL fold metallo-hydrolase [Archangium sp.]|nr:MBL fold metallo-hydrolase [Archangium sp.]